jgi:hypothetical protein
MLFIGMKNPGKKSGCFAEFTLSEANVLNMTNTQVFLNLTALPIIPSSSRRGNDDSRVMENIF